MTDKKSWTLTWEFKNNHVWDKTFLTEAEARAFVERSIEGDPNVLVYKTFYEEGK